VIARHLLSTLLAAVLLLSAAGCSLFPEPPAAFVGAASKFEEEIRALPGVASATAEVRDVDPKDKPGQFYLSLVVTATNSDGLTTLPDLLSAIQPPAGLEVRQTLNVPAGPQVAKVSLNNSRDVARAKALRVLPFVTSVRLDDGVDSVQVSEGVELAPAIAALRESGTLTADPFDSVSLAWDASDLNVSVSMAGPSAALVEYFENAQLQLDQVSSSEPRDWLPRPIVNLVAPNPDLVAKALSELVGDELEGRPRTAFSVYSDTQEASGYVGLPLGSPKPDDLTTTDSVPPPVDEEVRATQIAADTRVVTDFLLDTAKASGIPGTPEMFVGSCASPDNSPQVQGALLLPVFDFTNSAEPAYAAVTKSWEAVGYIHSEQATGTAIFTPQGKQPIVQATVRGTSDGIRISAMAACIN